MLLLGQECRHNKCQLHHEAGKTHLQPGRHLRISIDIAGHWGMTTVFVFIGSAESHISINDASKGDTHLPQVNFDFGELTGLGDFSLNFVAFLLGGREWIWKAVSCQSHCGKKGVLLICPPHWTEFAGEASSLQPWLSDCMCFFWYPTAFHAFLFHSFSTFMCVYGGANLCMCTQVRVSLYVWGLKINNQESAMTNPSPYPLRQGIPPNPGSLKPTQGLPPNPGLGGTVSLMSQIALRLHSFPFLRPDLQAGLQTQHSSGFSGSKLWLSCSLCKHARKWAVSSTPRTLIWNFNIYPFRQHGQGFRWL